MKLFKKVRIWRLRRELKGVRGRIKGIESFINNDNWNRTVARLEPYYARRDTIYRKLSELQGKRSKKDCAVWPPGRGLEGKRNG